MSIIQVAAAVIIQNQQVLLAKRPANKHKGGYWEFPGGKIETGETAQEALKREIKEEINLTIENGELFEEIEFSYPEKTVNLKFYLIKLFSGIPQGMEGQPLKWVNLTELGKVKLPEANLSVIEKLEKTLG